ncbi:MAG: hypothetical protein V1855_02965 [bacterium]
MKFCLRTNITIIFSFLFLCAFSVSQAQTQPQSMVDSIEKYNVIGWSLTADANIALFIEHQNPCFDVQFINDRGEFASKRFQAHINCIGTKIEAAIKIDGIFIVGTDYRFFNTKCIQLGTGIDLNISALIAGMGLTYVPFKNIPGGMLIIAALIPLISIPSIALVTGGVLLPLD